MDIINHNSSPENSWKKGINGFTDMTFEEFAGYYLMAPQADCSATEGTSRAMIDAEESNKQIPKEWDWREH